MNEIYGKLNSITTPVKYAGGVTDTATVTIDTDTNIIYVDTIYDEDNLTDIIDEVVDDVVSDLDYSDTAVDTQFVTKVSETNGVISVTRSQPQMSDVQGLTTVVSEITNSIETLDSSVQTNTNAITLLNADEDTEGSVDYKIKNLTNTDPYLENNVYYC